MPASRLVLLLSGLAVAAPAASSPSEARARVVILGFDGADARLVERYMDEGALPNLARLREKGAYFPLGTTNPAQSPVSWASLNAGVNPGKTGVFDFVNRVVADRETGRRYDAPRPEYALLHPTTVAARDLLPFDPDRATVYGAVLGALLFALGWGFGRVLFRRRRFLAIAGGALLGGLALFAVPAVLEWIPREFPAAKNPQRATPFWDPIGRAGVAIVGLQLATAFPLDPVPNARLLAGLGVPDARGGVGNWFLYTSDETESIEGPPIGIETETGGNLFRVENRGGKFESWIPGPKNFWKEQRLAREVGRLEEQRAGLAPPGATGGLSLAERDRLDAIEDRLDRLREERLAVSKSPVSVGLRARIDREAGRAVLEIGGEIQTLAPGEWSDFYRVKFALNPLVRLSALVRVKLLSLEDPFRLYVDPLNFDPSDPPPQVALAHPPTYSRELARAIGLFETLGWACATHPLKDSVVDDQTFLEDVEFTQRWRERMLDHELARPDWRVFFEVFSEQDRVQHMMFRHLDPAHPLHRPGERPGEAGARLRAFGREFAAADAIRESYREMDRIVGKALAAADERTVVLVVSDHGFSSFRKGVNVNNWLLERGYLAVKGSESEGAVVRLSDLQEGSRLLRFVDWERTRAYSIGLGKIYLNLKEREPRGVVEPEAYGALCDEIARAFEEEQDPETGERFVRKVYRRDEVYEGNWIEDSADLILGFAEGYRVSWQTTLGGLELNRVAGNGGSRLEGGRVLVPNELPWSGDHCSLDPPLVAGVFFSNRAFAPPAGDAGVDVLHVAPTVLDLVGLPVPPEMDRRALRTAP